MNGKYTHNGSILDREGVKVSGRRWPSPAVAVSITAVVLALGGVAWASIPGSDGVIKGCYANSSGVLGLLGIPYSKGDLRVVDSAENCRTYETTLPWNQTGPKGAPGAPGATKVVVRGATAAIPANSYGKAIANCNPGEVATGGGAAVGVGDGLTKGTLIGSTSTAGNNSTPAGWVGEARTGATADTVFVQVVCASP
jgi:hypothetical protein